MKIVFLGYAVSAEEADILSGCSVAGNKMQLNVLNGFAKNNSVNLNTVTIYPVAAYPKEKRIFFFGRNFKNFAEFLSL